MLERPDVRGSECLADVSLELPRLSLLSGPNPGGRDNVFHAVEVLSAGRELPPISRMRKGDP